MSPTTPWLPTELAPHGDSARPALRFPSAASPFSVEQMPKRVIVRSKNTGSTRLAAGSVYESPADATAALTSPSLLKALQPSFDTASQFTVPALVRAASFLDAIRYAPRGFGKKLLGLLAAFSLSALGAAGVLLSGHPSLGLWVWFGVSVIAGLITFAVGVDDALTP